jgi:hypothetical protein
MFIPGQGNVDTDAYRVDCAVKEYDERLMFTKNEQNGDWCIFIRMPRPEPPYPILGFGNTIPSVDAAMRRLKQSDTMRNGEAIYNDMMKSQEIYRKNLQYKADQASEESAEPVEFLMRKEGKSPVVKVFYNKGGDASDD